MRKLTQEEVEQRFQVQCFELLDKYINVRTKVKTKCICNNIFYPKADNILRGLVKSCGCSRGKALVLTQKEVVERFKSKNLELLDIYHDCESKVKTRCFCGKIFKVRPAFIFNGCTRSCGCILHTLQDYKLKNLVGLRVGSLVVQNRSNNKKYKHRAKFWNCQCDCGRFCIVVQQHLTGKRIKSCGNCKQFRNGKLVSNVQLELHKMVSRGVVNFKTGKYWVDIAFVKNNKKIAIEYDSWRWHSKNFVHDQIRTKWLLENGWSLLSVKSDGKLPNDKDLHIALEKICTNECRYHEIILSDWSRRNEL